jgi:hypothetical protein
MNNIKDSQLGYYLAGLIEGDGCILTLKSLKSPNARIYNPQITITFHVSELPLFKYMKEVLGAGSIYPEYRSNAYTYRISDKNTLIEVINMVNGKFRTPKIIRLHRAIDQVNLKHGTKIEKLPLDSSNLGSNP